MATPVTAAASKAVAQAATVATAAASKTVAQAATAATAAAAKTVVTAAAASTTAAQISESAEPLPPPGPPFNVGRKKIYLPNHRITFVPPKEIQPPTWATFIVPLRFNKLDMRDYLYHAYKVEVTKVRSFITGRPLSKSSQEPEKNAYHKKTRRPAMRKMMTVELVKPFLYPKTPEDLSPWDNDIFMAQTEAYDAKVKAHELDMKRKKIVQPSEKPVTRERIALAKMAQALRDGTETWSNQVELDEKWTEVEADVEIPRK